jgi:hypothetical protein
MHLASCRNQSTYSDKVQFVLARRNIEKPQKSPVFQRFFAVRGSKKARQSNTSWLFRLGVLSHSELRTPQSELTNVSRETLPATSKRVDVPDVQWLNCYAQECLTCV